MILFAGFRFLGIRVLEGLKLDFSDPGKALFSCQGWMPRGAKGGGLMPPVSGLLLPAFGMHFSDVNSVYSVKWLPRTTLLSTEVNFLPETRFITWPNSSLSSTLIFWHGGTEVCSPSEIEEVSATGLVLIH